MRAKAEYVPNGREYIDFTYIIYIQSQIGVTLYYALFPTPCLRVVYLP